ncbi:MAG: O-antigen ligase family protein [Opitutales bacterium]
MSQGPSIAPRERAVALCGGATLAFTAWGFAGVMQWSLHTLLLGGLLTWLCAVIPLPRWWNGHDGEHGNGKNIRRLLGCPFFWFSLAFLIYICIQALNPDWVQVHGENGWWVEERAAIDWLPSGTRADYEPMNAFRVMANFGAAFSLAWGLWVGLRRRAGVLFVLWVFLFSGVAMAVVAIVQGFSGADAVLWTAPSANEHFWGSYFYRNQGVAYLNAIITACAVLYFYHANRSEERGMSGGPHLLLFFFVMIVFASVCLALSRGGILFGGALVLVFLILALGRWLFVSAFRHSFLLSVVAGILLAGGAVMVFQYVDIQDIERRFGDIEATIEGADEDSRVIVSKITWKMAQDSLWDGWGAGSWRYVFPMYQKSYPEIFYRGYNKNRGWFGRRYYRYAHNDILQFLAEFGIVGCGLLILAFGYWIVLLLFSSSGNALAGIMLLAGMALIAAHAFLDFIFQSPTNWVAFNGLVCLVVKLLSLHSERSAD